MNYVSHCVTTILKWFQLYRPHGPSALLFSIWLMASTVSSSVGLVIWIGRTCTAGEGRSNGGLPLLLVEFVGKTQIRG